SNGVNLTDGLDGLATGAAVMVFTAFILIGVWEFGQSCAVSPGLKCYAVRDPLDLAVLAAALAGMVGFYVWFTQRRIGQILPEDNLTAQISDGAGELGFYSPHSWWPLPVALSMCALTLSLIIGWWLTVISLGALVISIIGMVTQYEKPIAASAH
ncbi:MAG: hypothetical protein EBW76_02305, partial [Actinobacteria bacterium]|nr:hypothetical protein [Actinomycetota bacterium]